MKGLYFQKAAGIKNKINPGLVLAVLILVAMLGVSGMLNSGCELLEEPSPEVGQVDLERVLEESRPGQELQAELNEIGRELKQQYEDASAGSPSETVEQEEIFQRYLRQKERLENSFQAELEAVLAELAEEKGLKTVLTAEVVYSGALDITAETVEKLDELAELAMAGRSGQEAGRSGQ